MVATFVVSVAYYIDLSNHWVLHLKLMCVNCTQRKKKKKSDDQSEMHIIVIM